MARFNFDVYHNTATTTHVDEADSAPSAHATPPSVDKAYFTAEEAAQYMNLPLAAFRVLAADPELRPVRVNGDYYYRVAAVQRFLIKMEMPEDS